MTRRLNTAAGALFACAVAGFPVISSAASAVLAKETPVYLGPSVEWRGTIATDSSNQPHIVTTEGMGVRFYDKIGGTWLNDFMSSSVFGSSQFGNPHMEIAGENAWISGSMVTSGMGVVFRTAMSTAPTAVSAAPKIAFFPSPAPWENGNLSVDPARPNECVVSAMGGYWGIVQCIGGSLSVAERGRMYDGDNGGEKNVFRVSKAGNYEHPSSGSHAVWHGAIGGWDRWSSSYQNSVRDESGLDPATWAAFEYYPGQNLDETYVGLCSDNREPLTAYIASDFPGQGVYLNIYNGSTGQMVFNPNGGLLGLGGESASRYAPQLTPAKNGGAWVCWNKDGAVRVRYVGKNGVPGTEETVDAGYIGAICTDSAGNLHVAYVNGGLWYRKLLTSDNAASRQVVAVGDFDADGTPDLAWQAGSGAASNQFLNWNPASSNCAQLGYSLLGATSTVWTIRCAADLDSNGSSDLIWQEPKSGQVYSWLMNRDGTVKTGKYIYTGSTLWEVRGAGDIDRDGVPDLVWQHPSGAVCVWFMSPDGGKKSGAYTFPAATPWKVRGVGDINHDGVADIIWQHPLGHVCAWLMAPSGTKSSSLYIYEAPTIWQLCGVGDMDGDGTADLFWQLPTGQVAGWLMNTDGSRKFEFNIIH